MKSWECYIEKKFWKIFIWMKLFWKKRHLGVGEVSGIEECAENNYKGMDQITMI